MKKYCIINTSNIEVVQKFEKYGYVCIPTKLSNDVSTPISLHADVLYLKTDKKTIYISECQQQNAIYLKQYGYTVKSLKLSPGYKTECKLNLVLTDDIILCNPKTCINISDISNNRNIIYTNQGYTKCSTVVIDNANFITEDISIYESLVLQGKNCLLIEKGYVNLKGYDYGFIGGASVYLEDEKVLLFFGNIQKHINYPELKEFCKNIGISIDSIESIELCDIGGAIIL